MSNPTSTWQFQQGNPSSRWKKWWAKTHPGNTCNCTPKYSAPSVKYNPRFLRPYADCPLSGLIHTHILGVYSLSFKKSSACSACLPLLAWLYLCTQECLPAMIQNPSFVSWQQVYSITLGMLPNSELQSTTGASDFFSVLLKYGEVTCSHLLSSSNFS